MQKKVLLVNIYAPNFDDVDFANRVLSSLPLLNTQLLILSLRRKTVDVFDPIWIGLIHILLLNLLCLKHFLIFFF